MRFVVILVMLNIMFGTVQAQADSTFATVIDKNEDSALVTVRDNNNGWIRQFKPDALEISELKVGDSVRVSWSINQVSSIKGQARRYPLLPLAVSAPCCDITDIKSDTSRQ